MLAAAIPSLLLRSQRSLDFYPDRYPEGLGIDLYDERSVHSLLIHKPSGKIAGTVRIILPMPGNSGARFPSRIAGNSFYTDNVSLKSAAIATW